ncbi:MAG: patatin-like phospholipase family protein [Hyphomicrobium sp.]|jgi:NTE family protein
MTDTPVPARPSPVPAPATAGRSIALALGGGGARGLAHIPILEAFDELGLRPKVIAGTSIGAIFAAAYASGLSGKQIRAHTYEVLKKRLDLVRDLYSARVRNKGGLLNAFAPRPAFLSAEKLLDIVLPPRIARDFAHLTIPLKVVASDFYAQESVVFSSGALRPAVAASMALPVIFQPMVIEGRVLIDGGLVNPLPFDLISDEAELTVAVDASGAPVRRPGQQIPKAWETLFAANFIFERSIIREKLRTIQPDLYIDAGTSRFQILDFLKIDEILAAAEPAKERVKAQLSRLIEAETLPVAEAIDHLPPPSAPRSRLRLRRPILKRRRPAKG